MDKSSFNEMLTAIHKLEATYHTLIVLELHIEEQNLRYF